MKLMKRCDTCGHKYELLDTKKSHFLNLLIWHYPCPKCSNTQLHRDMSKGACLLCKLPFSVVKEHAKDLCGRCYVYKIRSKCYKNKHI